MAKANKGTIFFTIGLIIFIWVIVDLLFTRCCYDLADKLAETTPTTTISTTESLS